MAKPLLDKTKPIFEIWTLDANRNVKDHIEIYENGNVEGIQGDFFINNRIIDMRRKLIQSFKSKDFALESPATRLM